MTSRSSELAIQKAVIKKARSLTREFRELALLHHIPNGGLRDPKIAIQLRSMGALSGIPDLFLPVPCLRWHGLYIELKTESGSLSVEQKAVIKLLRERRYYVIICKTDKQAIRRLLRYITYSRTPSTCRCVRKCDKNHNK